MLDERICPLDGPGSPILGARPQTIGSGLISFGERSRAVAMLDHAPTGGRHRLLSTSSRSKIRPTKIRPSGDPAASSIDQPFWHVAAVQ
jgi:hypothetical protein